MITPFPNDLLAMLDGDWATAQGALKQGLASQNAGQAGYGRFDHDIIVPAGTLTYKSGIWVPVDVSGANLVLTDPSPAPCQYSQVGSIVHVVGAIQFPATASAAPVALGGFPIRPKGDASSSGASLRYAFTVGYSDQGNAFTLLFASYGQLNAYTVAGAAMTNAAFSGKFLRFSGWYLAAS